MIFPLTERRLTIIGLILGLLVLIGLAAYATDRRLEQTKQRETFREIRSIVEQIMLFQSHLSDAESGQRGFLLTHDQQYLAPYHVALEKLAAVSTFLEQATKHDTAQRENTDRLRLLTEKKLAELRTSLEIAQHNPAESIDFVRSNAGKLLMDDLRFTLKAILEREYQLLQIVDQQERQAADEAFHTIGTATLLALVLLGVGTYRVIRDSAAREQADRLRDQARLLNLAPIMTRDMDGRVLSWSKGYEKLYGWTEEEAVGKISHDLLQTRFTTPPDEIQATLLRDGQWIGELTHRRHDGTTIPVAAQWTLLKEERRRPTAVVEVNTDISDRRRAEQVVAEQTAFTRSILNSLEAHIAVVDQHGVILQVNDAWQRFANENNGEYSPDLLGVGSNYLDVARKAAASDETSRQTMEGIEAVLAGRVTTFEHEYPCHSPSRRRWFYMSVSPLKTAQGGAVISHVDITLQKTAEEAQAFLAAIVTASPDAIISKALDGTIVTWNRGAEGLFGYPQEEIVRQPVEQLVPNELKEEELKLRSRVLQGTSVEQFETQRRHKQGRRIDVSISMSPIRDETGAIIAIAQTMRDITYRKQAEKALQASEERFRTLTKTIPQLVWSCRPDGACEYMSEQWLAYTGTTIEENLGFGWLSTIHPDDAPTVDRIWREAVASGSPYVAEYRLRAADGSYRWHLARGTSQRDDQGLVLRWFGTTTDISSQKENEAALERINTLLESKSEALAAANKELEAFSYSVSHDLRAPLRTMTGFAQALIEDYGEKLEPEAARYLRIISSGASQMGRLIDDLLSFSRLSRQNLAVSPISMAELVQEIRDELAADQADRTIEWDIADLPTCRGDRTTIKLVLANLIGNALKYTRPRDVAKIQIGWEADDQQPMYRRIFVKDNGVGFDMQYVDKVFTVFQRLHRPEEFEGTGVGLAIVQRIVHRHGGLVWADAKPNGGATFWFTLEGAS